MCSAGIAGGRARSYAWRGGTSRRAGSGDAWDAVTSRRAGAGDAWGTAASRRAGCGDAWGAGTSRPARSGDAWGTAASWRAGASSVWGAGTSWRAPLRRCTAGGAVAASDLTLHIGSNGGRAVPQSRGARWVGGSRRSARRLGATRGASRGCRARLCTAVVVACSRAWRLGTLERTSSLSARRFTAAATDISSKRRAPHRAGRRIAQFWNAPPRAWRGIGHPRDVHRHAAWRAWRAFGVADGAAALAGGITSRRARAAVREQRVRARRDAQRRARWRCARRRPSSTSTP